MKKIFVIFIIILAVTLAWWKIVSAPTIEANSNATTSIPIATSTDTGGEPSLSAQVTIDTPQNTQSVGSKFTVSGQAPGPWYFEATFPIKVADEKGNIIASTAARAQRDWMTTSTVPFTATVDVGSYKGPAVVSLLKDNPSGLPENDDSVSVSVNVQ